MSISNTWIKTTKKQKQDWMLAEEGSWEDSGSHPTNHIYRKIRGSYWTSVYVDQNTIKSFVDSLALSTFSDATPKSFKKVAASAITACKELGREDLAEIIEKML